MFYVVYISMSRKSTHLIGHHLIGRSQRHSYNISDKRNIAMMEQHREKWLHELFQTLLTPHEQFEYINNLWLPIQSKIIKELVEEINNTPPKDWYDTWLMK